MKWSNIKEITEVLKNVFTLLFYITLVFFFVFFIIPKANDFQLEKLDIAGTQWTRTLQHAGNKLNEVPRTSSEGQDTQKVNSQKIFYAQIVETQELEDSNWVYLGQIIDGKLCNSHFNITKLPNRGDKITAKDAVYKRNNIPFELEDESWKLGKIVGVVTDNETVTVNNIVKIKDDNYWALVK